MANAPITDADRERVRELHAEGLARNAIAAKMGRSQAAVSKIAKALGLDFDRSRTAAATEAKVLDARARRAQLMHDLLDDANRLRRQLWEPTTIYSFGGKDNTYNSKPVDRPPFKDQRDIMGAASLAITASLRLDEHDTAGAEGAKSMLGALATGLQVAYDQLQPEGVDARD